MENINTLSEEYIEIIKSGHQDFNLEDIISIAKEAKGDIYTAVTYALTYGYMRAYKEHKTV